MFESAKPIKYKLKQAVEKYDPFHGDNKGITFAINTVTSIIAVSIALLVGALILSKISPKIVGSDQTSNDTINNTIAAGYGAIDIATIIPYVLVAGAAIVLIMLYFGGGGRSHR